MIRTAKQALQTLAIGILCSTGGVASAQYTIHHIAGTNDPAHTGDSASAYDAALRCPTSVCRDAAGNLYIGDGGPYSYKNDACVRKINKSTGMISTITGIVNSPGIGVDTMDFIKAKDAMLMGCSGICIDKNNNLYIADGNGSVRRVNMNNDTIYTVAGNRRAVGYRGDNGPAIGALLDGAYDVAVDPANNLYIVDKNNHAIRKVNVMNGIISTVAGVGLPGDGGDGGLAVNARLNSPHGIYVDANFDLYIADYGNNKIRKVTAANGVITTIAGTGPGFTGDTGLAINARLAQPARVTMDNAGNLYIADAANQRIRKIDKATGIISTFAGNGAYFSGTDNKGNGGPALKASITPYGMTFDNCDNLYFGSVLYSVRVVAKTPPAGGMLCGFNVNAVSDLQQSEKTALQVYPNPSYGLFTIHLPSSIDETMEISVTDITGRKVKELSTLTNKDTEMNLNAAPGIYFVQVATAHGRWEQKIVIQ